MSWEPWLCINGLEVVNPQRTLTYLRQGLAGRANVMLNTSSAPNDPSGLVAYCSQTAEPTYDDPATDEAPWWTGDVEISEEFLGLVVDVEVNNVLRRGITELAEGGAVVGRQIPRARTVNVSGYMMASSPRGMRYGEDWLREILAGPDDMTLDLLKSCDAGAFRQVLEAGVTDGPNFGDAFRNGSCTVQTVAFQLTGGNAYLYSRPETIIDEVTVAPGASECVFLEVPEYNGDMVIRVEVQGHASEDVGPIEVRLTPTTGASCPDTTHAPVTSYDILGISPGSRICIDSRVRDVTQYDVLARGTRSGYESLDFVGGIRWLELESCEKACFCVTNTEDSPEDVVVSAYSYLREF